MGARASREADGPSAGATTLAAKAAPATVSAAAPTAVATMLRLQRTAGNRAVGRLVAPRRVLQRQIVISPQAYARGQGAAPTALTQAQLDDYRKIAVLDDLNAAMRHAAKVGATPDIQAWRQLATTFKDTNVGMPARIAALDQLVTDVNQYQSTYMQVFQDIYTAAGLGASVQRPTGPPGTRVRRPVTTTYTAASVPTRRLGVGGQDARRVARIVGPLVAARTLATTPARRATCRSTDHLGGCEAAPAQALLNLVSTFATSSRRRGRR